MKQRALVAVLAMSGVLVGLACSPGSLRRDVGLRNLCGEPLQVVIEGSEEVLVRLQPEVVEAGNDKYLLTFGDQDDVFVRWSPVGVELDNSLPVSVFEPGELEVATETEQDEFGYEFYVVVEGDSCP